MDTATQWLEAIPAMARTALDYRLLGLALRHANRYDDPGLDSAVANLADDFVSAGDNDGAAVALTLATIIAHMRGDLATLLAVAERAAVLPSAGDEPMLRFLGGIVEAATASLEGDPAAAVRAIEALSFDGVPGVFTDLVLRLQVNMLCLCGRAAEAVPIADRLTGVGQRVRSHDPGDDPLVGWRPVRFPRRPRRPGRARRHQRPLPPLPRQLHDGRRRLLR